MSVELLEAAIAAADRVQLLSTAGDRDEASPWAAVVADLTPARLIDRYRDMVVVRRIDTEATALQRQGELGLWPPLLGQEAAQIGSARALRDDDFIFSSYRENAVAYVRGVAPADLLVTWRGVAPSGWNPYDHNMATPQVIIGAQALHATGYAMGLRLRGSDAAAISYFGDGATSEGDVSEALVFAASLRAPVVFFCQNNGWAISEPVMLQSRTAIVDRAAGFGIPGIQVDGNDVLAVEAVTRSALERARRGDGPTFIEAVTYRMGPHTTADDPTRYRPAGELDEWAERDPISRLRSYLRTSGVLDDTGEAAVQAHADEVAAELRATCLAIADPHPLSMFAHVFSEPHRMIDEQRGRYEAYLGMFS
ncbi:pyruvate dehydrogenase (acetyl-transferring) E1 component subunit alpha [soil metagenome]